MKDVCVGLVLHLSHRTNISVQDWDAIRKTFMKTTLGCHERKIHRTLRQVFLCNPDCFGSWAQLRVSHSLFLRGLRLCDMLTSHLQHITQWSNCTERTQKGFS